MIDTTMWIVGGIESTSLVPSTVYTNEIINPSSQVTSPYKSKVGLMYISDYAFAAAPNAWTTNVNKYGGTDSDWNTIRGENWMFMGLYEWTITRLASNSAQVGCVHYLGGVSIDYCYGTLHSLAVRPVFHLLSSITYVSGFGTKSNPIRLSEIID